MDVRLQPRTASRPLTAFAVPIGRSPMGRTPYLRFEPTPSASLMKVAEGVG